MDLRQQHRIQDLSDLHGTSTVMALMMEGLLMESKLDGVPDANLERAISYAEARLPGSLW